MCVPFFGQVEEEFDDTGFAASDPEPEPEPEPEPVELELHNAMSKGTYKSKYTGKLDKTSYLGKGKFSQVYRCQRKVCYFEITALAHFIHIFLGSGLIFFDDLGPRALRMLNPPLASPRPAVPVMRGRVPAVPDVPAVPADAITRTDSDSARWCRQLAVRCLSSGTASPARSAPPVQPHRGLGRRPGDHRSQWQSQGLKM